MTLPTASRSANDHDAHRPKETTVPLHEQSSGELEADDSHPYDHPLNNPVGQPLSEQELRRSLRPVTVKQALAATISDPTVKDSFSIDGFPVKQVRGLWLLGEFHSDLLPLGQSTWDRDGHNGDRQQSNV
jgi:hypothetical protein